MCRMVDGVINRAASLAGMGIVGTVRVQARRVISHTADLWDGGQSLGSRESHSPQDPQSLPAPGDTGFT